MVPRFILFQSLLLIPVLGMYGCYDNYSTEPYGYYATQLVYSATFESALEYDSTTTVFRSTANLNSPGFPSGSGWSVTLNAIPLEFNSVSNYYSSDSLPSAANGIFNWFVSKGSRSNLAELNVAIRNPTIPTKISMPNDTTVISIDSAIVVTWIPDSSSEPVHWEVIDSAGHLGYQWQSRNTGLDTIYPYFGQYRPLAAGPSKLIMWRDNNYQGYADQFNYQVDAETQRTVHFRLK
jgi:hypothetical protein